MVFYWGILLKLHNQIFLCQDINRYRRPCVGDLNILCFENYRTIRVLDFRRSFCKVDSAIWWFTRTGEKSWNLQAIPPVSSSMLPNQNWAVSIETTPIQSDLLPIHIFHSQNFPCCAAGWWVRRIPGVRRGYNILCLKNDPPLKMVFFLTFFYLIDSQKCSSKTQAAKVSLFESEWEY